MSDNWFARQRRAWIKETLDIFGFINRDHLIRKFGISLPQASNDLMRYQVDHPDSMYYNHGTKRYEVQARKKK
jgi:hypothetical protein